LDAALDEGRAKLRALDLDSSTRSWARLELRRRNERDPDKAIESLGRLARDLGNLQEIVQCVYERVLAAEVAEAERLPYQQAWLANHKRKLAQLHEPARWAQHWLDFWMSAVADADLDAALTIVEWRRPVGNSCNGLRDEMRSITHELRAGQHPTISAVDELLGSEKLSSSAWIRLCVLKARTLLLRHGNPHEASELMSKVAPIAAKADSALAALVDAVRAEIAITVGDPVEAKRHVHDVFEFDEEIPDRIIAAGRIALALKDWARAAELFDAAATRFGTKVIQRRLLAEPPSNLVLAVARFLREQNPAVAADQYQVATGGDLVGPGTKHKALLEYAEVLCTLGRTSEAAATYARAADLYPDTASKRALTALVRAHELDPTNADYCWSLGELLRFRATDIHGIGDRKELRRAADLLEEGIRLADPSAVPGWVLVSFGLAAHSLDSDRDPAAWLERAILRDGPTANNCGLLAWLHRRNGYALASERIAKFARTHARVDPFLLDLWLSAYIDLGRFDDAFDLVEDMGTVMGKSDHAVWRGWIKCRSGQPAEGLAALDEAEDADDPEVTACRLACYERLGDESGVRTTADLILRQEMAQTGRHRIDNLGWAQYSLGRLDDATSLFEKRLESAPQYHTGAMNLALVLLARGNAAHRDIERGRTLLLDSIAHVYSADEIVQLLDIYLDQVARRVAGRPHDDEVRGVVEEARTAGEVRLADMRTREPDPGLLSQELAAAREFRYEGELAVALGRYAKLSHRDDVPEAAAATGEVASALIAAGDQQLRDGDFAAADATWLDIADALASADATASMPDALSARLGLSRLERGSSTEKEPTAGLHAAGLDSLVDAVPLFARSLDLAWDYCDGLRSLADGAPGEVKTKFERAAAAVPFEELLLLRASDVESHALVPSARACEILFSPAQADQEHSPDLGDKIGDLRMQVKKERGLSIPGVRLAVSADQPAGIVTYRVFDQVISQFKLKRPNKPEPEIVSRLADILADNLFRWISIDDLDLWNRGWTAGGAPKSDLPEDLIDRVRLTRVLRSLLSEGIPITDRNTIVDAFRAGTARGSNTESTTTLTTVRRHLYPNIKAPGNGAIAQLPAKLEESISSALDTTRSTMARNRARALRSTLRKWRAETLSSDSVSVAVRETALRHVVWHLLSDQRPRVYVLANAEISDEERQP
jgi:tetratricopeptide (TPR) repeat protein